MIDTEKVFENMSSMSPPRMNHLSLPKLTSIGMMAVLMNVAIVSFTATDTLYFEYVS